MKKIFLTAAIAAVAATSCTKSDVVDIRQDVATDGISFNAYTSGTTKAEDITTTNVTDETFAIEAYLTDGTGYTAGYKGDAAAAAAPDYYFYDGDGKDDVLVYENDTWHTENGDGDNTIYFWPTSSDEMLSFFATNAELTSGMIAPAAVGNYPSFSYTVDGSDMQDLLVANTMEKKEGIVSLDFEHALAKLNFKAQGASDGGYGVKPDGTEGLLDYTYVVESLTISGLKSTGTFTFNGSTSAVPGAWTGHSTDVTYSYDLSKITDLSGLNTELIPLTYSGASGNNSLLVLPQATSTSITISVKFYVTYDIDGDGDQDVIYPLQDDNTAYASVDKIPATKGIETMKIALSADTFMLNARSQTSLTLVLPSPGDLLTYKVDVNDWDAEVGYAAENDDDGDTQVFVRSEITSEDKLTTTVTYATSDGSTKQSVVATTLSAVGGYVKQVVATYYDIDDNYIYNVTTTDYSAANTISKVVYEEYVANDADNGSVKTKSIETDTATEDVETVTATEYDSDGTTVTSKVVTETDETEDDVVKVTVTKTTGTSDTFGSKVVTTTTTGTDLDSVSGATKSVEVVTYKTASDVDTTVTTYTGTDLDSTGATVCVVNGYVKTYTDTTTTNVKVVTVSETDASDAFVSKVVTTTTTGTDLDSVSGATKSVKVETYKTASDVDTTVTTYTGTNLDSTGADTCVVVGTVKTYTGTLTDVTGATKCVDNGTTKTYTGTDLDSTGATECVVNGYVKTYTNTTTANVEIVTVSETDSSDAFVSKVVTTTTTGTDLGGVTGATDSVEVVTYSDTSTVSTTVTTYTGTDLDSKSGAVKCVDDGTGTKVYYDATDNVVS